MLGADLHPAPLGDAPCEMRTVGALRPAVLFLLCMLHFILFFSALGQFGKSIDPLAQSDNFHIVEIQYLCKTHQQIMHPQTAPPSLLQG